MYRYIGNKRKLLPFIMASCSVKLLKNLERIVTEKTIFPLQINDKKCGFGHFYYAMNPADNKI